MFPNPTPFARKDFSFVANHTRCLLRYQKTLILTFKVPTGNAATRMRACAEICNSFINLYTN